MLAIVAPSQVVIMGNDVPDMRVIMLLEEPQVPHKKALPKAKEPG
jgi:hypothetical protein